MLVPTAMPMAAHAPGPQDILVAWPAIAVIAGNGPTGLFGTRWPCRAFRVVIVQQNAAGILRRSVTECGL